MSRSLAVSLASIGVVFAVGAPLRADCVEAPVDVWTCTAADTDGMDATTNGATDTITVVALATVSNAAAASSTILMSAGTLGNSGDVTNTEVAGTALFAGGAGDITNSDGVVANADSATGILSASGTVTNNGTLSAIGASGTGIFVVSGDATNSSSVLASGEFGVGILGGGGDNTISNQAAITATGQDGIGIATGAGADTVLLGGSSTTSGGPASSSSLCTEGFTLAVCTGSGDDVVTVDEGATVNETLDGGPDTDTLEFSFLSPADLVGLSPAAGSLVHNAQTYQWINFEELVGSLPQVSIGDLAQAEGSGGGVTTFTFTLTRSGGLPASTVEVSTADDSAVAPGDYAALSSVVVSFAADQTVATVDVAVAADGDAEPDETFSLTLANPSSGQSIADGTAVGTILNDDQLSVLEIPTLGGRGLLLLAALLAVSALPLLSRAPP